MCRIVLSLYIDLCHNFEVTESSFLYLEYLQAAKCYFHMTDDRACIPNLSHSRPKNSTLRLAKLQVGGRRDGLEASVVMLMVLCHSYGGHVIFEVIEFSSLSAMNG